MNGLAGHGNYWLQSSDETREVNILDLMRQLHDPRGISSAARLLQTGSPDLLVKPAVRYLAEIGGPESVDMLISVGQSHSSRFEDDIREALQKVTGQDFGTDWERWRSWQRGQSIRSGANQAPLR